LCDVRIVVGMSYVVVLWLKNSHCCKAEIDVTRQQRMAGRIACWDEMRSWSSVCRHRHATLDSAFLACNSSSDVDKHLGGIWTSNG
jgi:hypothetical protein